MKMNLLTAALLVIATSSQAFTNKPDQCPSTDSIKTVTVDENDVKPVIDDMYMTKPIISKFDTKDGWSFAVGAYANSQKEAARMINKGLTFPVFDRGPYLNNAGKWVCEYHAAFNKSIIMNAKLI